MATPFPTPAWNTRSCILAHAGAPDAKHPGDAIYTQPNNDTARGPPGARHTAVLDSRRAVAAE